MTGWMLFVVGCTGPDNYIPLQYYAGQGICTVLYCTVVPVTYLCTYQAAIETVTCSQPDPRSPSAAFIGQGSQQKWLDADSLVSLARSGPSSQGFDLCADCHVFPVTILSEVLKVIFNFFFLITLNHQSPFPLLNIHQTSYIPTQYPI